MLDLLLRNGRVVTASAVVEADIGIKDGKIAGDFFWRNEPSCIGRSGYIKEYGLSRSN